LAFTSDSPTRVVADGAILTEISTNNAL
jgi:hypothetical protein